MRQCFPLAGILLLAQLSLAGPGEFGCQPCHTCGGACVMKATPVVEDETCYEVECKEVCIPAVRFPWDSCRTPKCGRVRLVSQLKKSSRETRSCKYEWVVVCPRCGPIAGGSIVPGVPPAPEVPKPPAPPASPAAEKAGSPGATVPQPPFAPVDPVSLFAR